MDLGVAEADAVGAGDGDVDPEGDGVAVGDPDGDGDGLTPWTIRSAASRAQILYPVDAPFRGARWPPMP